MNVKVAEAIVEAREAKTKSNAENIARAIITIDAKMDKLDQVREDLLRLNPETVPDGKLMALYKEAHDRG